MSTVNFCGKLNNCNKDEIENIETSIYFLMFKIFFELFLSVVPMSKIPLN